MTHPSSPSPSGLERCPFCGCKASPLAGSRSHRVRCDMCYCEGPVTKTAASAIEVWNRRAPTTSSPIPGDEDYQADLAEIETWLNEHNAPEWDKGTDPECPPVALSTYGRIDALFSTNQGGGLASHLPSQEWLDRKVASDPGLDCEAGDGLADATGAPRSMTDLMITPEAINAALNLDDAQRRVICDFMGWPEDGPAWDDAGKLVCKLAGAGLPTAPPPPTPPELAELSGREGWVLVPLEPTEAMLKAANKASLSTEVLMDNTRFACERATYVAAVRQALSSPAETGT